MFDVGEDLNYASIAHEQVALLRAATRYFGSWRNAIEFAGLNYDDIRRYKTWNRDRILERIQELYANGEDLSWRHVSTKVDPQLAAAATKRKHFGSWREAVSAAGLNYGQIRRYREWDENTIKERLHELHEQGIDLNAKHMEDYDITLITAARRRYDSWDKALTAAGLDYKQIVLRAPFKRRRTPPHAEMPRTQHRAHHSETVNQDHNQVQNDLDNNLHNDLDNNLDYEDPNQDQSDLHNEENTHRLVSTELVGVG